MDIIVREVIYLGNIWFPKCHRCKRELKPYIVDEEEQILMGKELLSRMKKVFLTVEKLSDGNLIILLCNTCLNIE